MGLRDLIQKGRDALDARIKQRPIQGQTRVIEEEEATVYEDEDDNRGQVKDEAPEGYDPKQASPEYHKAAYREHGIKPGSTHSDVVEDILTRIALTAGTIVLWLYLSYSQTQVFTGFRFPSLDFYVLMMAAVVFVIELCGLVALFRAARNFREKNYKGFGVRIALYIVIGISGFLSQLLLLNSELVRHVLSFPDSALTGLYINQGFVFVWRGLLPAAVQVGLVFLIPEDKYDYKRKIKENREHQEALHALEKDEAQREQEAILSRATTNILRAQSEGLERAAKFLQSGQQTFIDHVQPKQILTYVHEPERIPEQASSMQNAAPPQSPTQMPQNLSETPNRQPDRKKPVNVPPVQKNVRIESQRVRDDVVKHPTMPTKAPEVKPEPQVARLTGGDEKMAMVRIILQNPDMKMGEIVSLAAPTFGGTQKAYHWYTEAIDYLQGQELPQAVNAQRVPIMPTNPRDRFTIVEDAEDGGIEDEDDSPFPEGR